MILDILKDIDILINQFNKEMSHNITPDFLPFHQKIDQLNAYLKDIRDEELEKYQEDINYLIQVIRKWKNIVSNQQQHVKELIENINKKTTASDAYRAISNVNDNNS